MYNWWTIEYVSPHLRLTLMYCQISLTAFYPGKGVVLYHTL